LGEPFAITTVPPFGKIDFGDRAAVEIALEGGLNFGKGVEPHDEFAAGLAVAQAAV
jgi:hypothetical protein